MNRQLLVAVALVVAAAIPLGGRTTDTPLQEAAVAWDRGDYATALKTYLQILDSSDADTAIEPIALQTGELYRTTELTSDGDVPIFAPDGQHVAYETGAGLSRRTRVVRVADAPRVAVELPGFGASFSIDGSKIAYLRVPTSGAATAAQAALDTAAPGDRLQRSNALNQIINAEARVMIRDLASGTESSADTGSLRVTALMMTARSIVVSGSMPDGSPVQVYELEEGHPPAARTTGDTDKVLQARNSTGTAILFTARAAGGGGRGGRAGGPGAAATFGLLTLADGRTTMISGSAPSFSHDGKSLAFIAREGAEMRLVAAPINEPSRTNTIRGGPERLDAPTWSPDGTRIAFQMMPNDDWEIFVIAADGSGETRVTREIQHDVLPVFLTPDRILAAMGEPRHRRSYLYDLPSMARTRLFHNNTVRTIAPEYSWTPGPDGTKVLIAAERDGDTVSPERGVYLTDLSRRVTREELRERVKTNLEVELALAGKGKRIFTPIAAAVKAVVADASVERIYGYEKALFDFDSKYVTQPGNKLAAAYLFDRYRSFGYQPEYQNFEYRARNGPTGQTANVIATLKGTTNPDLIYVISSHYDSVVIGPGADDDSSGTAALLETARILSKHPQPATIIFASFTGEEAGLLGSREFVRQAVSHGLKIVGALNNDMIGWANDYRLDNTIRYSNAGIRDIQHAAAMQFTNLITYDALYYKNTDAAAYYEAYGDIVGGIGSYPVLGNPHYHQSHDLLEGINHQLVTEVAKTTAATVMLLASSPSRLKDLRIESVKNGVATVAWTPSPEKEVTGYIVAYGPTTKPDAQQLRVANPAATLTGVAPGTVVSVKAVNTKGLEGWDWARVTLK